MIKELKYPIIAEYPKGNEQRYDVKNPEIVNPIRVINAGKCG